MKRYIPNFRPPSKYRAQKTTVDGITFDSKAEAARYQQLKQAVKTGAVVGFIRQPSFPIPGGHRYRPDFLVKGSDGSIWVEDVKGFETPEFKLKRDLWREVYWWLPLRVIKNGRMIDE